MSDTKFTATQVNASQQQADLVKRQCYHAAGNFLSKTTPLNLHEDLAEYLNGIYEAHQAEIAELKNQIANMVLANAGIDSRLTKSVDLHNAVVEENNALKAQIELIEYANELRGATNETKTSD